MTRVRAALGIAAISAIAACRVPTPPPHPVEEGPAQPDESMGESHPSESSESPKPEAHEGEHDDAASVQGAWRERFEGKAALSVERGQASYYSDSLAGHGTASGEAYDPQGFTAAHKKLPFGSIVRVVRVNDGRSVYVRVNDRGPFRPRGRIIDLSRVAAEALGLVNSGVADVRLEIVEGGAR